jgi:hypothetical protein
MPDGTSFDAQSQPADDRRQPVDDRTNPVDAFLPPAFSVIHAFTQIALEADDIIDGVALRACSCHNRHLFSHKLQTKLN